MRSFGSLHEASILNVLLLSKEIGRYLAAISPPSALVRTIGDALNEKGISWAYYGGAYKAAVNLANGSTNLLDTVGLAYCSLCNFASYVSSIMGDPKQRMAHIKDATDFFAEVSNTW
jgi:phospholipase C